LDYSEEKTSFVSELSSTNIKSRGRLGAKILPTAVVYPGLVEAHIEMDESSRKQQTVFPRDAFESLLKRRLFFTSSFEIYKDVKAIQDAKGSTKGFYDYGPPGCALQANIVSLWRKHFVLEERMLEVDSTILTPAAVFETSGHVDKFCDWMCKDPNGDFLRADHLVKSVLENRLGTSRSQKSQSHGDMQNPGGKRGMKVFANAIVTLDESIVQEYEDFLAKVRMLNGAFTCLACFICY
jgi:glycyl-tRNA synthetase